ncbi:hypothetical protein HN371_13655 [Candidatus Poribacteria bacterium]|jgi:hypothetical protein|nr:hypothetical protein [Candidatus Poribacteria bacterium]MBT5713341.1 hypothetical protein [Candidatus Poribacteria bacterium]MBT7095983.1 hypothetical protein [Candidatus Poribacteria bacterium]MBT7804692.1 hypothetical protein [Candidatus Poribacteria bacterium]
MSAIREVLLGYHAWIESPSKEMSVAGFLVTNHRGIPIEFRYTDPVEITETQRMLYGETNHEEALAVTMAASLWKSVQQKPGVLLVEDFAAARLWEHLAGRQETRVAHLHLAPADVFLPELPGRVVMPVEADGERLAAIQAVPTDPGALAQIESTLTDASSTMRLDEPFERIEAILRGIHDLQDGEGRRRSAAAELEPESRNGSTVVPQPDGARRLGSEQRVAARLNQINAANRRTGGVQRPAAPSPTHAAPERPSAAGTQAQVVAEAPTRREAPAAASRGTRRPDLQWMYRNRGE